MTDKDTRKKETNLVPDFDLDAARKMAAAFFGVSGIQCCVHDSSGQVLHCAGQTGTGCDFCCEFQKAAAVTFDCADMHCHSAQQAERFGGRYVYSCPLGLTFFSAAIMNGGKNTGAMVGGPARMMDLEDLLDGDLFRTYAESGLLERLREELQHIPVVQPRRLEHMSRQLFANAVYVGDSSHELFLSQRQNDRQNAMGDYVSRLKDTPQARSYPAQKETNLFGAIARGDKQGASNLLNELLGYIFFYTDGDDTIRARITELLVVLSRAAIAGGANADRILQINQEYMQQMHRLNGQEELTRWLAASLNRYTNLVFDLMDVKHRNAMHRAIDYIKEHYNRKITLEEVARHSGYSPAYFSRIFAEEIGMSFKEYVNDLRIERSKELLLAEELPILEIGSLVGFNDQSYFCKIFKRATGVSPDVFRKRIRRIDVGKEYGHR